ncbi:MAG TPA: PIN domain-containing protein [Burkholderiaceae bacterium]|nr:PIN domain-containing protein [Burkholderiaceae bacterium]
MSVDFLDTNVFVYLFDEADAAKHAVARTLVADALSNGTGAISFQVVQEALNVLTRKLEVIARAADAEDFMQHTLQPLWRVQPSPSLYAAAMRIQQRQEFGFYDSLIVAAALESGCTRLLSEDLQHGQRIGKLRIENPFRT